MPLEDRKQLRTGAAACSDVEMLHAEVRVERVAEPHPPAERQPLARGVGDGVAGARAAQELGRRFVDSHPMGVRDDQAGVQQPAPWKLLPGHLHGVPQRHLLGLVNSEVLSNAPPSAPPGRGSARCSASWRSG